MPIIRTHPFDALFSLQPAELRLDCAALHLARDVYPHIDVIGYLQQLDQLAELVAERRPGLSATTRYQALREVLVEEHDFRGDETDYYDPQNSYLNRVLDRKRGLPITLSIVWIEVGRRLKWPIAGVGFPGHFLTRMDDPERFILIDPFHEGRALDQSDCEKLLQAQRGEAVELTAEMFEPATTRVLLSRVLNNLRGVYAARQDWPRLEQVIERLMAVEPTSAQHVQEFAALLYRRGESTHALRMLQGYLRRRPRSAEAASVESTLRRIEAALATMN